MRMNLLDISRLLGVVCVGMSAEEALTRPTGAAIDSRKVRKGNLFFCLPGEHVDGHDYAAAAIENGALAVIGTRNPFTKRSKKNRPPVLVVHNVPAALATVAAAHRRTAAGVVVGVTGTSGKTSVKETLASVLGIAGRTAKNPVNLNNQIGLPLSMLNAPEDAAYWVMEAGISRPHDMDELGAMLRPDLALILNAGAGHVQELGDRGVAHYKARLLAYLASNGLGVVSADYPDLEREARGYDADVTYFSATDSEEKYFASYLGPEGLDRGTFHLALDGEAVTVNAPFCGAYGAENVAAIGAVAHSLGLTASEIAEGFAAASLPAQRFALRELDGFLLIDDSYNANPLSMSRMLEAASDMAKDRGGDLVLVLGEMGELGPESPHYHYLLGQQVAALAPKAIIWKGGQGESVRRGLVDDGYAGSYTHVADAASFTAAFLSADTHSGVVLFKGSRSNRLEELVTAFTAMAGAGEEEKGRPDAV
ncbi:UDP-N-acetylmuramoyl-tripeptide--D-alanyl-D-alanine ligase [uncultured delta proteobacterium]|uniref:UDP-N-acetylmuramoyl-tripeptide--D-alanyl-D-alanine ligase n=1 Tax=uncultured delta proteobacterium TaxID=34034 RepID=A0A212JHI7_9DELT|nr:UDP-N-acetylmuramoyl-tripeptide--D-alanyl-D-alanine ligase [uncultured delta proteobacterium]